MTIERRLPPEASGAAIFIVIEKDRHSDTGVYPFRDQGEAIRYASRLVLANCRHPELLAEPDAYGLTESMMESGWVFNCVYGVEGDSVHVVRKELDHDNLA